MHIAVVGCGHGEIDKIYDVIAKIEERQGIKVSVVLCCGDFQSVRNMTDLRCMACPIKYQHMHDFHRYYSGEKTAPILTLFIGGNHEASNFLQELPYGGWVAPNIYYMGYVGVVRVGPLRIAGISGIYKGHDYLKGRHERPPYNQSSIRSVYHYRNLDVFRLKQIKQHVDIVLSHDWPKGIHQHGDFGRLLRRKPFFRDEIERNELGSRPLYEVMEVLKPSYWFSAHMHVKFAAYVFHETVALEGDSLDPSGRKNEDGDNNVPVPASESSDVSRTQEAEEKSSSRNEAEICRNKQKTTKFLALDKVLPRRQFLQIIEIPTSGLESDSETVEFQYDAEWLSILKSTNDLVSVKDKPCFMPGPGYLPRSDFGPTKEELDEIQNIFEGDLRIKNDFQMTAPAFQPGEQPHKAMPIENLRTKDFCSKLGITDPLSLLVSSDEMLDSSIALDEEYPEEYDEGQMDITLNRTSRTDDSFSHNPDEISLDLDDEGGESGDDDGEMDSRGPKQSGKTTSLTEEGSFLRNRLVLPPPKNEDGSISSDNYAGNTSGSSGFKRSSLILPPPKNDTDDGEKDREAMRSSFGGGDSLFFLDTDGEPNSKRKRDFPSE